MELIDKVIAIIEKTNDGNDLTPQDLKLTELAVNGFLNDKGKQKIDEIYQAAISGQYQRPPYLGVEFMDRDQEGYVYFKGQEVEHYSSFWAYSLDAKASLIKLQRQCLFLEAKGLPLTSHLQCDVKLGGEYAEEFSLAEKSKLDAMLGEEAILFSIVDTGQDSFLIAGHPDYDRVLSSPQFRDICSYRDGAPDRFSVTSYVYGKGQMWGHPDEETLTQLSCCFDYLREQEYVSEISAEAYTVADKQWDNNMTYDEPCEDEEDMEL